MTVVGVTVSPVLLIGLVGAGALTGAYFASQEMGRAYDSLMPGQKDLVNDALFQQAFVRQNEINRNNPYYREGS